MRSEGALFARKFDTDAINLPKWSSFIIPKQKLVPPSESEHLKGEGQVGIKEMPSIKRKRDTERDDTVILEKRNKKDEAT